MHERGSRLRKPTRVLQGKNQFGIFKESMMADNLWEDVTVWHELMSLDPERARKFYQVVIGLRQPHPWRGHLFHTPFGYRMKSLLVV